MALGARFLPPLARCALYVQREDVADLLAECEVLRPHLDGLDGLDGLAAGGGYLPDRVRERFANIAAAAERAGDVDGGVDIRRPRPSTARRDTHVSTNRSVDNAPRARFHGDGC